MSEKIGHVVRERVDYIANGVKADASKWVPGYLGFPEDKTTIHKIVRGYTNSGWVVITPNKQKYELSEASKDDQLANWLTESELAFFGQELSVIHAWRAAQIKALLNGKIVASDMADLCKIDEFSHFVIQTSEVIGRGGTKYLIVLVESGYRQPLGRLPEALRELYFRQTPPLLVADSPVLHSDHVLQLRGLSPSDVGTVLRALSLLHTVVVLHWPETVAAHDARLAEALRLRKQGLGVVDDSLKAKPKPEPVRKPKKQSLLSRAKAAIA